MYGFKYLDYSNLAKDDKSEVKSKHEVRMIEKEANHDLKKQNCLNALTPKIDPPKVARAEKMKISKSVTKRWDHTDA